MSESSTAPIGRLRPIDALAAMVAVAAVAAGVLLLTSWVGGAERLAVTPWGRFWWGAHALAGVLLVPLAWWRRHWGVAVVAGFVGYAAWRAGAAEAWSGWEPLHWGVGGALVVVLLRRIPIPWSLIAFGIAATGVLIWPIRRPAPLTARLETPPWALPQTQSTEETDTFGRCPTCHTAVTGPVHVWHAGMAVGCVTCHRGEPAATKAAIAHGRDRWVRTEPLLTDGFVEATCSGCHRPHGPPAGAERWRRGRELWEAGGCAGCHAGHDDHHGPRLARLAGRWAAAPRSLTGATLAAHGWPPLAAFLAEAVIEPSTHLPRELPVRYTPARMPRYGWPLSDVAAVVTYVMSLRSWGFPAALSGPSPPPRSTVNAGARLFDDPELGCRLCHSLAGEGGELGPPLDAWVTRPERELATAITAPRRDGVLRRLHPRDLARRLPPEALDALVRYIRSR